MWRRRLCVRLRLLHDEQDGDPDLFGASVLGWALPAVAARAGPEGRR